MVHGVWRHWASNGHLKPVWATLVQPGLSTMKSRFCMGHCIKGQWVSMGKLLLANGPRCSMVYKYTGPAWVMLVKHGPASTSFDQHGLASTSMGQLRPAWANFEQHRPASTSMSHIRPTWATLLSPHLDEPERGQHGVGQEPGGGMLLPRACDQLRVHACCDVASLRVLRW